MLRKTGIIISIVLGLILASAAICVSIILTRQKFKIILRKNKLCFDKKKIATTK